MKQLILNEKNLRNIEACKKGILFIKNTGLDGLNYYNLDITGNYDNFVSWLNNQLRCSTFNDNGNRIKYEDSTGRIVNYTYDHNRLIKKECSYDYYANYTEDSYDYYANYIYDDNGNKIKEEWSDGLIINYIYDNNRLIKEEWSTGDYINCTYDNNKLIKKEWSNGRIINYTYDNNRLIKVNDYGIIYTFKYSNNIVSEIFENNKSICTITLRSLI